MKLKVPQESQWIDVITGYLRVRCKPVGYLEQAAARAYAARMLAQFGQGEEAVEEAGGTVEGLPPDPDRTKALQDLYYAVGLAQRIIDAWEGPVDDDDQPLPVTADNIEALVRDMPYVGELLMQRVQSSMFDRMFEGNGFTGSSAGASAGPVATETPEDGNTASSVDAMTPPAAEDVPDTTGDDAPSLSTNPSPTTESSSSS